MPHRPSCFIALFGIQEVSGGGGGGREVREGEVEGGRRGRDRGGRRGRVSVDIVNQDLYSEH